MAATGEETTRAQDEVKRVSAALEKAVSESDRLNTQLAASNDELERVGVELQSVRGRGAALERKLAASEEAAKKAARSLPSVSAVEDEAAAAEMRARYWEAEAKKKKKMIQSR